MYMQIYIYIYLIYTSTFTITHTHTKLDRWDDFIQKMLVPATVSRPASLPSNSASAPRSVFPPRAYHRERRSDAPWSGSAPFGSRW